MRSVTSIDKIMHRKKHRTRSAVLRENRDMNRNRNNKK